MEKRKKDVRRPRKLILHTETLRTLSKQEIQSVMGGTGGTVECYSQNPADGFQCPHI
jgi:hypothetical protein